MTICSGKTYKSNDKRFKAIYQDYDWCYQKYIVEGLSHQEMADEANASKRVISKWLVEKYRLTQGYRKENKRLNKKQYDLIIASLLGDGHIAKREDEPIFIVSHANNQKEYLYWKYNIIKDLCNIPPKEVKDANTTYGVCSVHRATTRIHYCLKELRNKNIIELISELNDFSLSIYMLDDGHRHPSQWDLCIARYTDNEKQYLLKILKDRFGLSAYMLKNNKYIKFYAEDSRKLDKMIVDNIPNNIDVVKYKILENDKISNPANYRLIEFNDKQIGANTFSRENKIPYDKVVKLYDMGIKDGCEIINIIKEGGSN